jgi:hypothetical protein
MLCFDLKRHPCRREQTLYLKQRSSDKSITCLSMIKVDAWRRLQNLGWGLPRDIAHEISPCTPYIFGIFISPEVSPVSKRVVYLTDEQCKKIEPLIPKPPPRPKGGRPRADDRLVFEGRDSGNEVSICFLLIDATTGMLTDKMIDYGIATGDDMHLKELSVGSATFDAS